MLLLICGIHRNEVIHNEKYCCVYKEKQNRHGGAVFDLFGYFHALVSRFLVQGVNEFVGFFGIGVLIVAAEGYIHWVADFRHSFNPAVEAYAG